MTGTSWFGLYSHGRGNQQKERASLDTKDGNVGDPMNHYSSKYRKDQEIHTGTGIAFEPMSAQKNRNKEPSMP